MTTNRKILVSGEMLTLLRESTPSYQPEMAGVELLPETGDPQASLENMRRLLGLGLTYLGHVAGPGGILCIFQTGEAFLATGFALGSGPRAEAYAQACHELGLGDQDELAHWFESLGADYDGPVPR